MAKSDTKKQRAPQIEVVQKGPVTEATYFKSKDFRIVAQVDGGQFILTRYGWDGDPAKGESLVVSPGDTARLKESLQVKHDDTLIRTLGKRFALKEPHNAFAKIQTSLDRRGIPYDKR